MSKDKTPERLTVDKLRKREGYRHLSQKQAEELIEKIEAWCMIIQEFLTNKTQQ